MMLKSGMAKSQFMEILKRAPWFASPKQKVVWPFLHQLLDSGILSYLDITLTHKLLKGTPSQEAALFICHLLLAAKKGHLCVKVNVDGLIPSVETIWQSGDEHALDPSLLHILTEMIVKGEKAIPAFLLSHPLKEGLSPVSTPLCLYDGYYYLQRHWMLETQLLKYLKDHLSYPLEAELGLTKIQADVASMLQVGILQSEQAEAILKSLGSPLALITGGPGTGKTYTAGQLIKVLWNSLPVEARKSLKIALAAPTGKAAANLQKSFGQATASLTGLPLLQAKTLHALLGINNTNTSFKKTLHHLTADIVVVDECSMIDIKMMGALFHCLKPGSRLILLGDQHQLSSVEAGSIFHDLIQIAQHSEIIPSTLLKKCLRVELQTIVQLAEHVQQGDVESSLAVLRNPETVGIKTLTLPTSKTQAQKAFVDQMAVHFYSSTKHESDSLELLHRFNAIRILSPLRKGLFGVDELNQLLLQKIMCHAPQHGWLPIPIMVAANDYRIDLFNGETGVLMRKLPHKMIDVEDFVLFPGRNPLDPPRRLSALQLPKFEYAYCLSVYKSQGSEFERVVLVLPEGSEYFGREMLYTAITRARRHIDIYGSDEVIKRTIQQQGTRCSGLQSRF